MGTRSVVWSSSKPAVASVSDQGLVTALSAGTATIMGTSDNLGGSAAVTVTPPLPPSVASVSVALNASALTVGQATQATATTRDASNAVLTGRIIVWSSSNTAVATVSATGVVTAVAAGTATITATSEGKSGSATVLVASSTATTLFADGFESGALSFTQSGIAWISNAWVDVTTVIAHAGGRAARFRQGESTNFAELRFGGLPNLPEAFIQFYLYLPSGTESPSVGPKVLVLGGRNDKFFRLWGNTDSDYGVLPGDKVGASLWGDGQDGGLGIEYMYAPPTGAQWGMGEGPTPMRTLFVTDANRGRWVRMRIHAKVASAANNDGVVQIWADDILILSNTALHSYPGAGAPNTFTTGYLLGWANNGFQAGQYTYIDDVVISRGGFTAP